MVKICVTFYCIVRVYLHLSLLNLKLMVVKGTAYEYFFRNANDPIKKKIWTDRMEPYMDNADYPTVCSFYRELHPNNFNIIPNKHFTSHTVEPPPQGEAFFSKNGGTRYQLPCKLIPSVPSFWGKCLAL